MTANDRQVAGDHYRKVPGEQHWDRVHRLGLNYFQAMITRYVERYRDKNGLQDLEKAKHFLEKLIELERAGRAAAVMTAEELTMARRELWSDPDVAPADHSGS